MISIKMIVIKIVQSKTNNQQNIIYLKFLTFKIQL